MRSEVTNKNIRQRTVVILLVAGDLMLPVPIGHRLAVPTFDVVRRRSFVRLLDFGLGFCVLGPAEAAFDPHRAVMIEDYESATPRDIVGIIGVPFGFQPLDVSLKLAP